MILKKGKGIINENHVYGYVSMNTLHKNSLFIIENPDVTNFIYIYKDSSIGTSYSKVNLNKYIEKGYYFKEGSQGLLTKYKTHSYWLNDSRHGRYSYIYENKKYVKTRFSELLR